MTAESKTQGMNRLAAGLLDGMLKAVTPLLRGDGERLWLPYGSLPPVDRLSVSGEQSPSARLTCDTAVGFLAAWMAGGDRRCLESARGLLRHALTGQRDDGRYVWNYGQWETDQVDLGTVLDSFHCFVTLDENLPDDLRGGIETATARAIDFLATMDQPAHPGVIRKRTSDPQHPEARRTADYRTIDVINGNTLAVTAYCRAAEILGRPELKQKAAEFRENLLNSFSRHVDGWWAYIEKLDDRAMISPESILYQAMMVLYLVPLWQPGDADLGDLLTAAMASCAKAVGPDGAMDWTHENNAGFRGTQLLMLPSAAAALARRGICDVTGAALARLRYVRDHLADGKTGLLTNEPPPTGDGRLADELRQIWALSDLGLIVINTADRAEGSPS